MTKFAVIACSTSSDGLSSQILEVSIMPINGKSKPRESG